MNLTWIILLMFLIILGNFIWKKYTEFLYPNNDAPQNDLGTKRNKKTQSQVTYKRKLQTPRFKPLVNGEDGVEED